MFARLVKSTTTSVSQVRRLCNLPSFSRRPPFLQIFQVAPCTRGTTSEPTVAKNGEMKEKKKKKNVVGLEVRQCQSDTFNPYPNPIFGDVRCVLRALLRFVAGSWLGAHTTLLLLLLSSFFFFSSFSLHILCRCIVTSIQHATIITQQAVDVSRCLIECSGAKLVATRRESASMPHVWV